MRISRTPRCVAIAIVLALAPPVARAEDEAPRALLERGHRDLAATRYDEALAAFTAAAERFAALGDRAGEAEARFDRALVLIETGAMRRALAAIEAILAGLPADADARVRGGGLLRLAQAHRSLGELDAAAAALERAVSVLAQGADAERLAKVWAERSSIAGQAGDWRRASTAASRSLALATSPGARLSARAREAYARHRLGDLERAERGYREVLAMSRAQHDLRFVNFAYCNLAEVAWRQGRPRPAVDDLWRALDGIESARARIVGTPEERTAYLARQVDGYDRLIRYLVDVSDSRSAFDVAERFRARSFVEMLQAPDGSAAPDLAARQAELIQQVGELRLALQGAERGPEQIGRRRALEARELELDRVRAATRRPDVDGSGPPFGDVGALQAALAPDEVVVAFWVSAERTLVWVFGREHRLLLQVPLARDELARLVRSFLEPLRFPRRAEDLAVRGVEAQHIEIGLELYRWLIAPLPAWAQAARRLVIIPDAELHTLPFEALIEGCAESADDGVSAIHHAYRSCRFLGLEKALAYSPSAGTLLALRRRAEERDAGIAGVLAMAPTFERPAWSNPGPAPTVMRASRLRGLAPLAHADDEVKRIAGLVPASAALVGTDASEARFKSDARAYRMLHLATHGLVDDDLPMSSGVLLDAGDGEDGLLQANEILRMRIAAELVTLSSCRSGRGTVQRGQGIVGLSRAFLFAGASSVVVSLWDIDDRATPVLMQTFYRHVANGTGPAEALRAARHELFEAEATARLVRRQRPLAYAHPRFWAGFVLLGVP